MIEPGTVLDNTYKVIRAIGSGGGGEIYLADHLRLEKKVVIKKIKDNVQGLIEDRGEADILKRLRHPYLPQVYDFFVEGSRVYTVIEYIEGENFKQLIEKGQKFSEKDIIKWGTQLSEVVTYLHSQTPPIIHRDIKPANIMLTPKQDICLIDFNVSLGQDTKKMIQAHSDGYSPPEQYKIVQNAEGIGADKRADREPDATEVLIREDGEDTYAKTLLDSRISAGTGKAEQTYEMVSVIDERSDIYSLGASLYFMITRKRPEKATEQVTPLRECDSQVSDGLTYIIDKAMRREPDRRFQRASDMYHAFVDIKKIEHEYISYACIRDVLAGVVILTACISIVCAVFGSEKMKAEAYDAYVEQMESADELYDRNMLAEAGEACEHAAEMRPDDLSAYVELARIYYMQQSYDEAISKIRQLNVDAEGLTGEEKTQWAALQFWAGECYMELEEFDLAAACYQDAIKFYPEKADYYTRYAIALARGGDTEGAEKFLADVLKKGISDAAVYLTKAEVALSEKKYDEAESLVYQVLDVSKDSDIDYHAYLTGAQIYEDGRNVIPDALKKEKDLLERAVSSLDSSYELSLSEKLADIYYELAGQEKGAEQAAAYYEKSLSHFNNIFQNGYRNFHVLQNIAIISQTLGNYEEAESVMLEMVDIYPEDYRGYMYIAQLYADIQSKISIENRDYGIVIQYYDEADRLYQKALDQGGDTDTNMQALGSVIEDFRKLEV